MISLSLLVLLTPVQSEALVNEGLSRMASVPVGIDGAIAEFDRLCLAAPFDRAGYQAAIARSGWHFRHDPGSGPAGALGYVSSRGYTKLIDFGRLPQCNFDTAIDRAHGDDTVVARIEKQLARRYGAVPERHRTANTLFWQLPSEGERPVRLYLMRRPGDDPRQFSLSLQKWPAALSGSGAGTQSTERQGRS